jgi:hypothetical protein
MDQRKSIWHLIAKTFDIYSVILEMDWAGFSCVLPCAVYLVPQQSEWYINMVPEFPPMTLDNIPTMWTGGTFSSPGDMVAFSVNKKWLILQRQNYIQMKKLKYIEVNMGKKYWMWIQIASKMSITMYLQIVLTALATILAKHGVNLIFCYVLY